MRTEDNSGHKKPAKMARIIKTPVKALTKALDLYVKGVTTFSDTYHRPLRVAIESAPDSQRLRRSFTTSRLPDNDQPPEGPIVRSISAPATCGRATDLGITSFELQMIQRHCRQMQPICGSRKAALRNCCAAMGKIDEDRASSFRDDNVVVKSGIGVKDEGIVLTSMFGIKDEDLVIIEE